MTLLIPDIEFDELAMRKQSERDIKIKAMQKQQRITELRKFGIHGDYILDWTFENDDGSNSKIQIARKYVENWEDNKYNNFGLLIWGNVGTGKSYMAGCIANYLINNMTRVTMTNFSDILSMLSDFNKANQVDNMLKSQLLIIDDLGIERNTAYAMEKIYGFINQRYLSKKPLIITTNLTLDEIKNPSNQEYSRIYDRILEMCIPVKLEGQSKRQEIARRKAEEFKRIIEKG